MERIYREYQGKPVFCIIPCRSINQKEFVVTKAAGTPNASEKQESSPKHLTSCLEKKMLGL